MFFNSKCKVLQTMIKWNACYLDVRVQDRDAWSGPLLSFIMMCVDHYFVLDRTTSTTSFAKKKKQRMARACINSIVSACNNPNRAQRCTLTCIITLRTFHFVTVCYTLYLAWIAQSNVWLRINVSISNCSNKSAPWNSYSKESFMIFHTS